MEIGTNIRAELFGRVSRAKTVSALKIRAGIVGAGLMGRWHAHAIEKAGGEVVGISDFDLNNAQLLAACHRAAKEFGDLKSMLAERQLDVLHVCSPTESHEEITAAAAAAGVHLLIEKPLAQTEKETIKLYELAAKNGVLLCPVHQFAFQRGAARAERLLPKIGQPIHIAADIRTAGGAEQTVGRLDSIAADILPHPLSVMQKFLPAGLSEADWNVFRPTNGELRIFGRTREISLSISISLNSRPTQNSFQIAGSSGTIHLDLFHGFAFLEPGKTSRMKKVLHPFDFAARSFSSATLNLARRAIRREAAYPGLRHLIEEFYQSIKRNSPPPVAPADAIAVARVRDLLIERAGIACSEQSGKSK